MTKKRIIAMMIAFTLFSFSLTGCGNSKVIDTTNNTIISSLFQTIPVSVDVSKFKQTLIYDTETLVEYAYLWNTSNGHTVSSMLYEPDGSPKLYSGQSFKLVLISTEEVNNYTLSIIYDSENFVMYCISLNTSRGCTTFETLCNADGTLKTYQ